MGKKKKKLDKQPRRNGEGKPADLRRMCFISETRALGRKKAFLCLESQGLFIQGPGEAGKAVSPEVICKGKERSKQVLRSESGMGAGGRGRGDLGSGDEGVFALVSICGTPQSVGTPPRRACHPYFELPYSVLRSKVTEEDQDLACL